MENNGVKSGTDWSLVDEPLKQRLKKNTITNIIFFIATFPLTFIITPMIIHRCGKEIYGVWALVATMLVFVELIAGMQASVVVSVMIPKYDPKKSPDDVNMIINTMFFYFLASAGICLALYFLLRGGIIGLFFKVTPGALNDTVFVVTFSICAYFAYFLLTGFQYLLIAYNVIYITNTAHIITAYIRTAAMIFAIVRGYGIRGLVIAQMAALILEAAVLLVFAKKAFPPLSLKFRYFSVEKLRQMAVLSGKFVAAKASNLLLWNADRLIIAYFINPAASGLYQIGSSIAKYISSVPDIMGLSSLLPATAELRSKNLNEKINAMFERVNKYMLFVAVLLVFGIVAFGRDFTLLWLGRGFEDTYRVMAVLAVSYTFGVLGYPAMNILNGMEKIRGTVIVSAATGGATLVLGVILTKIYGLNGMLIASSICIAASGVAMYALYVGHIGKGINFIHVLAKPLIAAVIGWAAVYFIPFGMLPIKGWPLFFARTAVFSLLYLSIAVFVLKHFDEYDINMLKNFAPVKATKG
jgi:O-antigen/teichoic acid export membrane protein